MPWNPATGLAYANTLEMSFPYQIVKPEYKKGERYLGMNLRGVNFPAKGTAGGYLNAIDPMTGKSKWQMAGPGRAWPGQPSMAGTLSTAGGLVFTGAATGEFIAVDANNGQKLWKFQTSSGIIGPPVTWAQNGQQYLTIVVGAGGVWALLGDERMARRKHELGRAHAARDQQRADAGRFGRRLN